MPDKLTDSKIPDIKELLEYKAKVGCQHCDLIGKGCCGTCVNSLIKQFIEMFDRLQAENEKLQNFKAYFDFYYGSDIEILGIFDEFYNCAIANAESIEHHIAHIIKTAKAEAYKEVFEKLNDKSIVCKVKLYGKGEFLPCLSAVTLHDINRLKKEMVGEDNV